MQKDLSNSVVVHCEKDEVQYMQFRRLMEYNDRLDHCFSTRIGGIGKEEYYRFRSCNCVENIQVPMERICSIIGVDYRNLIFSNQVHEDVIITVDEGRRGKGITEPDSERGCDALVTCRPNVALVTMYADCVPVVFYDPVGNVVASAHAGWRGTVKRIAAKTVEEMEKVHNCNTKDIIACIGPSIGPCCFQVTEDVANEFRSTFEFWPETIKEDGSGKSRVDLWKANLLQLTGAGLKEENIEVSGICTVCNNDIFYSYRADGGKTGRLCAIIQLK